MVEAIDRRGRRRVGSRPVDRRGVGRASRSAPPDRRLASVDALPPDAPSPRATSTAASSSSAASRGRRVPAADARRLDLRRRGPRAGPRLGFRVAEVGIVVGRPRRLAPVDAARLAPGGPRAARARRNVRRQAAGAPAGPCPSGPVRHRDWTTGSTARLYELEDRHWWFRARRAAIRALLERGERRRARGARRGLRHRPQPGRARRRRARRRRRQRRGSGRFCRRRGLEGVQQSALDHLPFHDGAFDLVLATDVVEHLDDDAARCASCGASRRPARGCCSRSRPTSGSGAPTTTRTSTGAATRPAACAPRSSPRGGCRR